MKWVLTCCSIVALLVALAAANIVIEEEDKNYDHYADENLNYGHGFTTTQDGSVVMM